MAEVEAVFGPARLQYSADGPLSSSSSPLSSAVSSESPRTATSFTFSVFTLNGSQKFSDDENVVAKVEELDDDEALESKYDLGSITDTGALVSPGTALPRRPRGRPRKHPKPSPSPLSKPPKGRSKTGCITCRRRKKKCDERKPSCMHCEKNNVHCEGYPPREIWQSGKTRAVVRSSRRMSLERPRALPNLIQGIETDLDWYFFDHFNTRLSKVLTLFREKNNPFQEILLPMATTHRGLMHSLLSLAGAHLINTEPESESPLVERTRHHFGKALGSLQKDQSLQRRFSGDITAVLEETTVAQVVFLCLKTVCEGDTNGQYRFHLDAVEQMLRDHVVKNEPFSKFMYDFIIYHDMSSSITSERPSMMMSDNFELPPFLIPEAGVFLGVCDGLFGCISKIRQLRDRIRRRRALGEMPEVDFHTILDGKAIDVELNQRECNYEPETPLWHCWQLYRTCSWLYLHRTINPSMPNEQLRAGVEEAVYYLKAIPTDHATQSVLLTPLFIVGCSAFFGDQRDAILHAFDVLQAYSSLGNIKPAREVVQKIWQLMDAGDESTWDWESVMKQMGYDLLIT